MSLTTLLIESLSDYNDNGTITLYHYTDIDQDELVLDVNKFGENFWTKRDKAVSSTPKLFFYLDPEDKERFFNRGSTLYTVDVSASEIYNVLKDPLELKKEVRNKNNGVMDIDNLITKIKTAGYKGMYYRPNRELVTWFENITVQKVSDEVEEVYIENLSPQETVEIMNGKYVVILSAERSTDTQAQRSNKTIKLFNKLKNLGYNFTQAQGGYVETIDGEKIETEETSFLVWSETNENFLDHMLDLGAEFNQETILYKSPYELEGKLIGTTDSEYLSRGEEDKVGRFTTSPSEGNPYYTKVGNLRFTFE